VFVISTENGTATGTTGPPQGAAISSSRNLPFSASSAVPSARPCGKKITSCVEETRILLRFCPSCLFERPLFKGMTKSRVLVKVVVTSLARTLLAPYLVPAGKMRLYAVLAVRPVMLTQNCMVAPREVTTVANFASSPQQYILSGLFVCEGIQRMADWHPDMMLTHNCEVAPLRNLRHASADTLANNAYSSYLSY
jgi:hypothetical protein